MFLQGRSVVMARRGMVASGHPLASAAGLRVLMSGGNAIDAAVATAAVLGVAQPMMSGVGGDTFLLYYPAREGRVWALNGSGIAPYAATREFFLDRGYTRMPFRGMLSVSVPGAVDAMVTALERWGSGRFSLAQLLEPAIFYAEEGFPVTEKVSVWIAEAEEILKADPATARIYLPQGRPPRPGEVLVQKDLAQTLRWIAQGGREVFYRGELARSIVRYCREHGGLLTEREFAEHQSEIYMPLETTYRGYRVLTTAPPSQGLILLEVLNILEEFELSRLGWGSSDTVHLMVEAKKLAFADRLGYVGDPRFVDTPVGTLVSKEYARRRARGIHPLLASAKPRPGALREELGATTYFAVADAEGNLVSYIASLSASFGCARQTSRHPLSCAWNPASPKRPLRSSGSAGIGWFPCPDSPVGRRSSLWIPRGCTTEAPIPAWTGPPWGGDGAPAEGTLQEFGGGAAKKRPGGGSVRWLSGLVVLAVGVLVVGQGLSVSAAVRIRYYGHAFFVVTAPDGVRFAIDPYGQIGYPLPEVSADVVLVTHEHRDHNNVGLVRGARTVLRGLTADGRDWNRIRERVGVTTVTSIPSFHDDQGGTSPRGLNTFFLMEMGDLRLAHLGDVGQPALTDAQLRALGRLDVLMIPVGDGPFTVGAAEATRIAEQLQPAVVIPMHYKTAARPDWPGTDEEPFLAGKRDVLRTGTTYEVRKDRLPRPTRVVVMDWR